MIVLNLQIYPTNHCAHCLPFWYKWCKPASP